MWLFTQFFNQCSNLNPLRTLFSDVFWGSLKWTLVENGITEGTSWYSLSNLIVILETLVSMFCVNFSSFSTAILRNSFWPVFHKVFWFSRTFLHRMYSSLKAFWRTNPVINYLLISTSEFVVRQIYYLKTILILGKSESRI